MMTDEEKAEIALVVKGATEASIKETFKLLGVDIDNFEHINEFQENNRWVKKYRQTSEAVGSRVMVTITTILTGGVIAAIAAYLGYIPKN